MKTNIKLELEILLQNTKNTAKLQSFYNNHIDEFKDYNFTGKKYTEKIYCYLNNINKFCDIPKCPSCNKILKFRTLTYGYNKYCNAKCQAEYEIKTGLRNQEQRIKKLKETNKSKDFSESVKNRENTIKKKYGSVESFNKIISEKVKRSYKNKSKIEKNKITEKRLNTVNKKYDGYSEIAKRSAKTMKEKEIFIDGVVLNHYEYVAYLKRLKDNDGLDHYDRLRNKRLKPDKNGKTYYDRFKENQIKRGNWLTSEELIDYKYYRNIVNYLTNKQNIKSLPNYDKRGKYNNDFHLDHKFSIMEGFKNNILPYYIGNINNLEFITGFENRSKKDKCSIDIDELFRPEE